MNATAKAAPEEIRHVGKQWVRREANGLLLLKFTGEVTVEEARDLKLAFHDWAVPGQTVYLLIDLRDVGSFSGDARAAFASNDKRDLASCVASFGASFQIRALSNLILTGMKMLGHKTSGVFVKDEAEARAWMAEKMAADGKA